MWLFGGGWFGLGLVGGVGGGFEGVVVDVVECVDEEFVWLVQFVEGVEQGFDDVGYFGC